MSDAKIEPVSDLLTGIAEIAQHLAWPERRVLHQHEKGMIPTFKQGRLVCARRSTLARHFAAQEAAAQRSADQ